MKTFFHPKQQLHHPKNYFSRGQLRVPQEIPERAVQILKGLQQLNLPVTEPSDFGIAPLEAVHDPKYLKYLETAHQRWMEVGQDWGEEVMANVYVRSPNAMRGILGETGRYLADGSSPIGPQTWTSAYWAAQSAIAATKAVIEGDQKSYALCRPPGHHTRKDAAGGFCYINNAAISAELLRQKYKRVVILDTDMHHGQGIQEIFYDRDDVYYISVHGDPTNFYPATAGFDDEGGESKGAGYNLNLPMPHGSSEEVFFERVHQALKALRDFKPDAVVLSLGFDVYKDDPQAKVAVTTEGFGRLGREVAALNLPTVVIQEGGYHLETLAANTVSFFNGFLYNK